MVTELIERSSQTSPVQDVEMSTLSRVITVNSGGIVNFYSSAPAPMSNVASISNGDKSLTTKQKVIQVAGILLMVLATLAILTSIGMAIASFAVPAALPGGAAFATTVVPAALFALYVGYQLWDKQSLKEVKMTLFNATVA